MTETRRLKLLEEAFQAVVFRASRCIGEPWFQKELERHIENWPDDLCLAVMEAIIARQNGIFKLPPKKKV